MIGIPPVMIRDAEHPVLGGGMGFVGVFLPFMGVRKIDLWQLGSCVFGIYLAIPATEHFLKAAIMSSRPALVNQRCQQVLAVRCSYRKCPQGGSTF